MQLTEKNKMRLCILGVFVVAGLNFVFGDKDVAALYGCIGGVMAGALLAFG